MSDDPKQGEPSATLWQLAKKSLSAWIDDYAPSMGAALAYYTLFSLAPLLLLVISVAGPGLRRGRGARARSSPSSAG